MKSKKIKRFVVKNRTLQKLVTQIKKGGVTYSPLLNKDYSGTRNIAISPFPERSKIFKGKATQKMVTSYFNRNNDLFQKRFSLGSWPDKDNAVTYLDIIAPIPLEKREEAITLGKHSNQIAGFNLYRFSEIPLGGTGEFNSSVPPFKERLEEALGLMSN